MARIKDLFDCSYGTNMELNRLNVSDCGIPFVSRTENNNGVSACVEPVEGISPIPGHTLSVALGGSVLATFYQPQEYYTGFHVFVLYPKHQMNQKEMLAYSVVIRANRYKYNYGRQANRTLPDILIPTREEISKICARICFPSLEESLKLIIKPFYSSRYES